MPMTAMNASTLLTSQEAAELLRISTRTLFTHTKPRGSIPCVRVGRSVRYCPLALQAWIDRQQEIETCFNNNEEDE